jgi:DNA-binding MarR family transcriptional regulator
MAPSGLRVTQYHLLAELERWAGGPPTIGELATMLVMERSALGQTLRPLQRDGFVATIRDGRDARGHPIVLTAAGLDAIAAARPHWARAHAAFESFFGKAALAELRSTLRSLAEDPELSVAFQKDRGTP